MVNTWKCFDSNLIKKSTKNKEFVFFEGQGGGEEEGDLHFKIVFSIIIGKHMKMLCFKFHQNCAINEKFDF